MHKYANSYIVIDTETGGFEPHDNPLTEVAMVAVDAEMNELFSYENLVQPYDNDLEYSIGAQKVTGITSQMCQRDGIPLKQIVSDMCAAAKECKTGRGEANKPIIVAHNANFENKFLTDVFHREGVQISKFFQTVKDYQGNESFKYLDTIDLCKMTWAGETNAIENFKLATCCKKAGIELIDAHRAMQDTRYTAILFCYLMDRIRSIGANIEVRKQEENISRKIFQF
jgi:DNA polymerase III epsilon subunit-like protein